MLYIDLAPTFCVASRLAFMDLSAGKSDLVWTPNDLSEGYYPNTYSVGARVHSDSW